MDKRLDVEKVPSSQIKTRAKANREDTKMTSRKNREAINDATKMADKDGIEYIDPVIQHGGKVSDLGQTDKTKMAEISRDANMAQKMANRVHLIWQIGTRLIQRCRLKPKWWN